ncbi:MAG: creatininase family protein [Acidobacteriota bacterium]|nr:creatininase family protein [Acidobacteriota bacterium]
MKKLIVFAVIIEVFLFLTSMKIDEVNAQKKIKKSPKIYKIEELTASQVYALDREKTLFFLPVGTLEQHGSHLPIGSDTYIANFYTSKLAERLSKSFTDRTIVLMPTINYSNGGANEIGDVLTHPGTYGIRQTTLRSIVADVGAQIAQNGFKWIFVIHAHGSPNHNLAISDACDFISQEFKTTMLNLDGLATEDSANSDKSRKAKERYFTAEERELIGWDIHAGTKETSVLLAVKPELVNKNFRSLPDLSGDSEEEILKIAKSKDWLGYFASPAKAKAEFGREILEATLETFTNYVARALKGENLFNLPRFPTEKEEFGKTENDWNAHEKVFEKKFEKWLKEKKRIE